MNCHQVPPFFSGRDSTIAVRKLYVSNPIATTKMTTPTIGDVSSCGWVSLL